MSQGVHHESLPSFLNEPWSSEEQMAPIAARCRYSSSVVHVLESISACETVKRGSLADRDGETSTMLVCVPGRCEQEPAGCCFRTRSAQQSRNSRRCYAFAPCLTRACTHQTSPGERDGDPSLNAFPKTQRAALVPSLNIEKRRRPLSQETSKPRPTIHSHLTKQAAVARATAGKVLASRCARQG